MSILYPTYSQDDFEKQDPIFFSNEPPKIKVYSENNKIIYVEDYKHIANKMSR